MRGSKKYLVAVLLAAGLMVAPTALAAEKGDWLVRGGAVLVKPDGDNARVEPLGVTGASVDDGRAFGYTFSYLYRDHFALSLLGVIPGALNHDIKAVESLFGVVGADVGSTDVFPLTLTAQCHYRPRARIRPYVGVGLNFTTFRNENAEAGFEAVAGRTNVEIENSWGFAGEVGLDVDLSERFFVNASMWYIDMEADATLTTTNVWSQRVAIDINPIVTLLAIGYRF